MKTLWKKLPRTILAAPGQFLALVLIVAIGVTVFYGMNAALHSLVSFQKSLYAASNFADQYYEFVRAPKTLAKQAANLPGVLLASGRIKEDVKIMRGDKIAGTGRLIGYTSQQSKLQVNRLLINETNRLSDVNTSSIVDVFIDPEYAKAHNIMSGDRFKVISGDKTIELRVVSTAISAEFLFKINESGYPDADNFVIIYIPQEIAEKILNRMGDINQIQVVYDPCSDREKVQKEIERLLAPYGIKGKYSRKEQLSHKFIQTQVDGLTMASKILPLLFLIIAVGVQFTLLRRLIISQHLQIGILKAIGYENYKILLYFAGYSLFIAVCGTALGLVGGIILAQSVTVRYAAIFNMPANAVEFEWSLAAISILCSFLSSILACRIAATAVTRVSPVEAFHIERQKIARRVFLEKITFLWKLLSSSWKVCLRSIARNNGRFIVTSLGMALTVQLTIIAISLNDSKDYMYNHQFEVKHGYDYIVFFNAPVNSSELLAWKEWTGVRKVEPAIRLLTTLSFGPSDLQSWDDTLICMDGLSTLRTAWGRKGEQLFVPENGILLNDIIAKKMNVVVGDKVFVQTKPGLGPVKSLHLTVMGINKQHMGGESLISLEQVRELMQDGGITNLAMLAVERGSWQEVEARLLSIPKVASVQKKEGQRYNSERAVAGLSYFTYVMSLFAVILGVAVAYNTSIITFNERKRELASLRVIGWSNIAIGFMLFNEIILAVAIGTLLGCPIGKIGASLYLTAISTDNVSWPTIIYWLTYGKAITLVALYAFLGHLIAVYRIRQMNLMEVLQNRE